MKKRAWGATIQNRAEKFELRRRAVLVTAARFIQRTGLEKFSLADIAAELNVSKPTIYYYFRNKEQIVRELMEMAVNAFFDAAEHPEDYPKTAGLSGAQLFERFIRRAIRVTSDETGACLFIVYPNQLEPATRRQVDAIGQPVIDLAEEILKLGMADGSISTGDPTTIYSVMINGLRAIPVLRSLGRGSVEDLSDAFVSLVMRGIAVSGQFPR